MTGLIGNFALCGATLAGGVAVTSNLLAWRLGDRAWVGRARLALALQLVFLIVASAALAWALVRSDFRYEYVVAHTDRSLGLWYRLGAFWSGQEGSILLWALILSALTCVYAAGRRRGAGEAATLGVLSSIGLFFSGVLLFGAGPFATIAGPVPADGAGLNPMLRHWAMVVHPPVLFVGYAGFAVPMTIMLGGLIGREAGWVGAMRRWTVFSWVMLTLGIALGAWWAYVELGWGGYWAWDPVENASLLPWLTGAGLIHAMVGSRRFGGFRAWAAWLALSTFLLCLLGTALTRSGFVQSVHAFAQSGIGVAFLVLLGALLVGGVWVIVARRGQLGDAEREPSVWSAEGLTLAGLALLVTMAVVTLAGTVMPLVSGSVLSSPVSVGPEYYNRAVLPLALALAGAMGAAPIVVAASRSGVRRRAIAGGAGGAVGVAVGATTGFGDPEFLACAAIGGFALAAIVAAVVDEWRGAAGIGGGLHATREAVIGRRARRSGAWLAHAGMVLVALGVAGSSIFGRRHAVRLVAGESAGVGRYTLRLDGLESVRGAGYSAAGASVLLTDARGRVTTLRPEQRFYDRFSESSTEVSLRSGAGEDVYVALVGWAAGGTEATLEVFINPLTVWIWIGSGAMVLGGVWAIVPGVVSRPARARVGAPGELAAKLGARAAHS